MKMTRFFKLRRALENLDVNYVAKEISMLEDRLTQHGQTFDPDNTVVTYEGIYYIHPQSGMAVRLAMYDCDHPNVLDVAPRGSDGITDSKKIETLNHYHLMRCNTLVTAEKNGWPGSYHVVQRLDDRFFYRYLIKGERKTSKGKAVEEVLNQKLLVCENCFMKVNSLLEGVQETPRQHFQVRNFFDAEYFGSWVRYGDDFDASESLANMYPKDWEDISRIRKEQMQHICEGCNTDFSLQAVRKLLHVHPIDYVKRRISYVKLQCLCIGCLAEYPERAHFKEHPDYKRCLAYVTSGVVPSSPIPSNPQGLEQIRYLDDDNVVRRRYPTPQK